MTYTPAPDYSGADWLEFEVTDTEQAVSAAMTVGIVINPVNDPPVVAVNNGLSLHEGEVVTLTRPALEATDIDDDDATLTFTIDAAPIRGTLRRAGVAVSVGGTFSQADINSGEISYDHDGTPGGNDSFAFSVTDGSLAISDTFAISVTPAGNAPVLVTNGLLTLDEGQTTTITNAVLSTTDADTASSGLTYTLDTVPLHGTLLLAPATPLVAQDTFSQQDIDDGSLSYEHDGTETTSDAFAFTVSDGTSSVSSAFLVGVTLTDDPPQIAVNAGLTVTEGGSVTLGPSMLQATDADNTVSELVFTIDAVSAAGVVALDGTDLGVGGTFSQDDINTGIVTFTHDGSEPSSGGVELSLTDSTTTISNIDFTIAVTAVSDPPTLVANDPLTVAEGGTATILAGLLSCDDADNTPAQLTYTLDALPSHGTVRVGGLDLATFTQLQIGNDQVSYRHDGSETATDSFGFSVTDATTPLFGNTFAITVTEVNDPPAVDTNAPLVVDEGGAGAITTAHVAASDIDVDDADPGLIFTITAPPANGTLYLDGVSLTLDSFFPQSEIVAGRFSYAHNGSETSTDWFGFSVSDANLLVADVFNITVVPVNDLPTATLPDPATVIVDQDNDSPSIELTGTDIEDQVESDLTVDVVSGPFNGSLSATTGAAPVDVVYTPNVGFHGADAFQFTVTDTESGVSPPVSVDLRVVGALKTTIDSDGDVGQHTSMAVSGGYLFVAYADLDNGTVKVARSDDNGDTWPMIRTVGAGSEPSVGVDDTWVYVSYWDDTALDLVFARSGDDGNTWNAPVPVDSGGEVGEHNDILVEATGHVLISYFDDTNDDLKVAASADYGDTWVTNTVDSPGDVGRHTSIALKGSSVFVSYFDATNSAIKFARSIDYGVTIPWNLVTTADAGPVTGSHTAVTADCGTCGLSGYIAYYDDGGGDLKLARSDNNGAAWTSLLNIDTAGDVGARPAITVTGTVPTDPKDLYVSYYDATATALKLARSNDSGDHWPYIQVVDGSGGVGEFSSIVVVGNIVCVAYYDRANGDLKFARSVDGGDSW
ncbi:cadherin-like domain-containing protein [Myxococcota bacterium]